MKEINFDELKEFLLYKRIAEWDENTLILDDFTFISIECTDWDCCAGAGGTFSDVELDAVITDIKIGDVKNINDSDTVVREIEMKIFHNQNKVVSVNAEANAGNGGYYYSVASVVLRTVSNGEMKFKLIGADRTLEGTKERVG
jgi:hypothetical protein